MKSIRRLALVALVLVSAVVVVASPAFATPILTTSTGTRPDSGAVSPFITPVGDTLTRSLTITQRVAAGGRTGSSLTFTNLAGGADGLTCIRLTASGEVSATHTRIQIYSLDFLGCRSDVSGLRLDVVVRTISSSTPYFIHLTGTPAANSTAGSLEIPNGSGIDLLLKLSGAVVCSVTVGPQSVGRQGFLVVTDRVQTITVTNAAVRFALNVSAGGTACPNPAINGRQTSATALPYTADDRTAYRATSLSSQ